MWLDILPQSMLVWPSGLCHPHTLAKVLAEMKGRAETLLAPRRRQTNLVQISAHGATLLSVLASLFRKGNVGVGLR